MGRLLLLLVVLAAPLGTRAEFNLFYGGAFDGRNALASERNTTIPDARTYDDFDVQTVVTVKGLWSNILTAWGRACPTAYWEIRLGVSQGSGGQLIASGTDRVRWTIIYDSFHWRIVHVAVAFSSPVILWPGRYHMTIAPIGSGVERYYVGSTDGGGRLFDPQDPNPPPRGSPRMNGNSYFDSPYLGYSWARVEDIVGASLDFSYGVGPLKAVRLCPRTFAVAEGRLLAGDIEGVKEAGDGRTITIQRNWPKQRRLTAAFEAISPSRQSLQVGIDAEVLCAKGWGILDVHFFDFRARQWRNIGSASLTTGRNTVRRTFDDPESVFVEPGTGRVLARLSLQVRDEDRNAIAEFDFVRLELVANG